MKLNARALIKAQSMKLKAAAASASSFSASLSLSLCLPLSLLVLGCWRVSLASFSHAPREPWEPDKNAHTLYRNSRLSHKTHTKLAAFLFFFLLFFFSFYFSISFRICSLWLLLRSVPLPATARDALRDLKIVAHTFRAKNTEKKATRKTLQYSLVRSEGRDGGGAARPDSVSRLRLDLLSTSGLLRLRLRCRCPLSLPLLLLPRRRLLRLRRCR